MREFILVPGETKLDHQTKQSIHSMACEVGALSPIHKFPEEQLVGSLLHGFSFRTNVYQV